MAPPAITTGKPRPYGAAFVEIGLTARHGQGLRKNSRAEVSHQPVRRRERKMRRFKSPGSAQRFVPMRGAAYNTFNVQRHLIPRRTLLTFRAEATAQWRAATAAAWRPPDPLIGPLRAHQDRRHRRGRGLPSGPPGGTARHGGTRLMRSPAADPLPAGRHAALHRAQARSLARQRPAAAPARGRRRDAASGWVTRPPGRSASVQPCKPQAASARRPERTGPRAIKRDRCEPRATRKDASRSA